MKILANTPDARGTCVTPFDRYEIGSYRVDPNYNNTNIGEWNEANKWRIRIITILCLLRRTHLPYLGMR